MKFLVIVLGLILLIFGRKLFWLFVSIVGFLVGMEFIDLLLVDQSIWVKLLGGLGAGLLGALLAIFVQRVAFVLAGFFAGAYFALLLAHPLGIAGASLILAVAGGVVGAIVAALLMDWAIIALSCLAGAAAIVSRLGLRDVNMAIVFLVLVIIGILVQAKLMEHAEEG
ncbi:MAG: DUF4203 domain-containing protein [Deltaproteobacteria bacterium]|nr:DUF4203 domain-containing protein [Deltaproteobacteria bacterium]